MMKDISKRMSQSERIYSFDWLRILAFAIVVLIHCEQMFGELYKVGGSSGMTGNNDGAAYFVSFVIQWCMALFFLLSGASTWLALRRRSPWQFIQERCKRLLLPLVLCFVLLVPFQSYFEWISNRQYSGTLFQFYPFFLGNILFNMKLNWILLNVHHLWFLFYLFGFSLISLPLCIYLRGEAGRAWIERLADLCTRPGGMLVLVLPIGMVEVSLRALFPAYCSLADAICWLLFYLYGSIIFASPRLRNALQQQGKMALSIGLASAVMFTAIWKMGLLHSWMYTPDYSIGCLLFQILFSITLCACLLVTLASGNTYLNFGCSFLKYGSAASFSWYLVHFPVVVIIAYSLLPMHLNVLVAFLLIAAGSYVITLILTDLFLLRMRGLLFLFQVSLRFALAHRFSNQTTPSSTTSRTGHLKTQPLVR